MGPVEGVMLLAAVVPLVLLGAAVVVLLRSPAPERAAEVLAARAGVQGTAVQTVHRAVLRSRTWSGAGLGIGLLAGATPLPGTALAGAVGGFLLGSAAAAAVPQPVPPGSRRVASLTPRRVEDYVGTRVLGAMRLTALACAGIAAAATALPSRPAFRTGDATWVLVGGGALVVALLVELAARRVVGRPQLAATPDDVRADDAIRSFSVHALVGSGLALVLLLLATAAWNAGVASDVQVLRWALPWLAVLALVTAPVLWVRVARRLDGVARTTAPAGAAG